MPHPEAATVHQSAPRAPPAPMHVVRRELPSFGLLAVLGAFAWFAPAGRTLLAQGVTTTAIRGTLRTPDGGSIDGAQVRVVNTATGFAVETAVRQGRVPGFGAGGGGGL